MVSVRWRTSANETGLAGDELEVLFRAMALGLANRKGALINSVRGRSCSQAIAWRFAAGACLCASSAWFHQGCSAALQMVYQVLCEIGFHVSHLLQCMIEGANGRDVLLPNTK